MTTLQYVTSQFPFMVPMLLVYSVGVALSLVHLERLGKPAAFALVGCGMLVLITALFPIVQGYILYGSEHQRTTTEMGLWIGVTGLLRMLLHAVAFALLLAAIFVDRRAPAGRQYGADPTSEVGFPKGDPGPRSSV
jgi:glucan phosphoethanolaminetransferase (alkaline phosphatase superfamily)